MSPSRDTTVVAGSAGAPPVSLGGSSPFFSPAAVVRPSTTNNGRQPPSILACSPPGPTKDVVSLQAKLLKARKRNELLQEVERGTDADGYPLCQYRKGFVDHLKGKSLVISTVRVSLTQAVTILVSFVTDQLELDLQRNKKVNEGEITQYEADLEAEEWENIEWKRRWKTFPKKFLTALAKFHAITLILRSYEYLAAKIVNLHQLDELTMDPFAMSKRIARKIEDKRPTDKPPKGGREEKLQVTISMTRSTLWANFLPFFADYSLHQGLLCYGYYKYYSYLRQKRLAAHAESSPADPDEQDAADAALEEVVAAERTALVSDLGAKSSRLASNRGVGWISSSVGAGIGSVVWPGWGTIVVSALGDSVAGLMVNDGFADFRKEIEEKQRDDYGDDKTGKEKPPVVQ